jgi:hypothetical protein
VEQSVFFTEGTPLSVNGIAAQASLASTDEIRIRVADQQGRSMLPYVRAAAFVNGLEDAPLSATRSANDRYLSIPLPKSVETPYSTTIELVDARVLISNKIPVTFASIQPSADDLKMEGLEVTTTTAGLKTAMDAYLKRMTNAVNGGDYELAVTLSPDFVESVRAYAATASVETTAIKMLLTKISESPEILQKAAKAMDDGTMGTTIESLQYDLLPALESNVMQAMQSSPHKTPENFTTPRATVYIDLNKKSGEGFSPTALEVPMNVPFMLIVRMPEPADHAFRLARVGDFETPDFTSDASSTSTLATGIYTLPQGKHTLACMKHPGEKLEIYAGIAIPPPAAKTPATAATLAATSETTDSQ